MILAVRGPAAAARLARAVAARPAAPAPSLPVLRKAACACGGGCARCRSAAGSAQVSHPGDSLEVEADRVAERIVRSSGRDATQGNSGGHVAKSAQVTRAAGTPPSGARLDPATLAFMEPRFGHSLDHVRVRTGAQAAQSAAAMNALAYTIGHQITFAAGRYAPGTHDGRHLLAHELAHSDQADRRANSQPRVMRKWDAATGHCADAATGRWIEKVVVDQEMPQTVTLHWSDSSQESARASAGKGHCCADDANPDAVACSADGSKVDGSNCTPITKAKGYPVQNRVLDHDRIAFWTEFEPARAIALHEYSPVDQTPLSHGCVRLDRAIAKTIFCGAKQNKTYVQVTGFARPRCAHPALQNEWLRDFATGGSDLSAADGDQAGSIRETRRMLNASFGRTLTEDDIRKLTVDDIPRCAARLPMPAKTKAWLEEQESQAAQTEPDEELPPQLDLGQIASEVHEAIAGWGTDEEGVYSALQQLRRDPRAIAKLDDIYQGQYGASLRDDIEDDFSGTELQYALQLLNLGEADAAQRIERGPPDPAVAARRIHDAVEGWGTDEEAVFATLLPFAGKTADLARTYRQLFDEDMMQRIDDEMNGSELDYARRLLGGHGR